MLHQAGYTFPRRTAAIVCRAADPRRLATSALLSPFVSPRCHGPSRSVACPHFQSSALHWSVGRLGPHTIRLYLHPLSFRIVYAVEDAALRSFARAVQARAGLFSADAEAALSVDLRLFARAVQTRAGLFSTDAEAALSAGSA